MVKLNQWLLVGVNIALLGGLTLVAMQITQDYESRSDRHSIEDVVQQYAHRWDAKDANGFASLFTEDVVVERWVLGELKSRLEGRPALLAYAEGSYAGRLADRQTRHHMSGVVFIALTEDSAVTENMVLITHQTGADIAARIASSGIYRNTWRRTDKGWKIAKRVLLTDRVAQSTERL